ncbi:MAG TPA: hypothetical protein VFJ58_25630 [Armatimonadota bacterium]|nr:hypothetical protein [Armatimonadota bacterium]
MSMTGAVIRATAPGRAGVVGNPTDGYGGSVISSTISERAWCEIRPSAALSVDIGGDHQDVRSEADLALKGDNADVARAVIRYFWPIAPAAITAGTGIPIRAGLSGSTAILTAIFAGVLDHLDRSLAPHEIAETARSIEYDLLKITCGFQDQHMIVFGGANYMDFRGKAPGDPDPLPWAAIEPLPLHENLARDGCKLLLGHTGVQRISGAIHKGLRERWIEGDPDVVDGYLQIATLAREGKKAVHRRDWPLLGAMMNENHAIQRDLGGSGEANERLIRAARENGALGAKLAGAGGGGTIIALCSDPDRTAEGLKAAGAERVWAVEPSQGLQVERVLHG